METHSSQSTTQLGARFNREQNATHFALYTGQEATAVRLVLLNSAEHVTAREIPFTESIQPDWGHGKGRVWQMTLQGIRPGQLYGYRVDGPYRPEEGLRYNKHKILLDPYAHTLGRRLRWASPLFGYKHETKDDRTFSEEDNLPYCPFAAVVDHDDFDWGNDLPLRTPWTETVIYETHVKGLSERHPEVDVPYRGTYLGLSSDRVISHLQRLGITAVELLPIANSIPGTHERSTYWGYDSLALFAPEIDHSAYQRPQARIWELKHTIKRLHEAGIEVILDIVFNHTAEGNHLGPTLSLRGLANGDYYLLKSGGEHSPYRYYRDETTGVGNTLNIESPVVLKMVLDCLRSWVVNYHVDGFRFDLATVLTMVNGYHSADSPFLQMIANDPILSQVKLIAEPWDVAKHHLSGFTHPWAEWNDRYRDCLRRIWRGDPGQIGLFATSLSGSKDLFPVSSRGPARSINFVTCHDGFPLQDLVSFAHKHNDANGEGNRDGRDENYSANYGVEGPTEDRMIQSLRKKQCRNFLATLLLSRGVPMILGGDEILRTQHGNNNAYCQDNELAWYDWENVPVEFLDFTAQLTELRRRFPGICSSKALGEKSDEALWFKESGQEMESSDWLDPERRTLGKRFLSPDKEHDGKLCELFLLFNFHWDKPARFVLPTGKPDKQFEYLLATEADELSPEREMLTDSTIRLQPRSLVAICASERR